LAKRAERKALALTERNVAERTRATGNLAPTPAIVLFVRMPTRTHSFLVDGLGFLRPGKRFKVYQGNSTTSFLEDVDKGH